MFLDGVFVVGRGVVLPSGVGARSFHGWVRVGCQDLSMFMIRVSPLSR